ELNEIIGDDEYEVKTNEIKDGDLVVITCYDKLSNERITQIKDMVRRKLSDLPNVRIFVLDDNIDMRILRKVD
ncbi:MAG: hypothetical protein ACE5RH_01970, partial [Nitrosarchaeum sp.]